MCVTSGEDWITADRPELVSRIGYFSFMRELYPNADVWAVLSTFLQFVPTCIMSVPEYRNVVRLYGYSKHFATVNEAQIIPGYQIEVQEADYDTQEEVGHRIVLRAMTASMEEVKVWENAKIQNVLTTGSAQKSPTQVRRLLMF